LRSEDHPPDNYVVREGFYQQPYNLEVERRVQGNVVEVYLRNRESGASQMIDENMRIGDADYQLHGCYEIGVERVRHGFRGAGRLVDIIGELF